MLEEIQNKVKERQYQEEPITNTPHTQIYSNTEH